MHLKVFEKYLNFFFKCKCKYFSFENLKCKYFRKVFKMHLNANAFDPMSGILLLSCCALESTTQWRLSAIKV